MRTALTCLLALGLAPLAHASGPMPRPLPLAEPGLCEAQPVLVFRGKGKPSEPTAVALTLCDGRPNPEAARTLAVLSRPGAAAPDETPGHLDAALLTRLQAIATHFEGRALELVSGYRPKARSSSRHRHGEAVDLRVTGIDNQELRDFARTLEGTGVGYYPNSSFVHIDVREESFYWVDLSGPGERADYVRDPEAEHPEDGAGAETAAVTAPESESESESESETVPETVSETVSDIADMTLGLEEVEAYLAQPESEPVPEPVPESAPESDLIDLPAPPGSEPTAPAAESAAEVTPAPPVALLALPDPDAPSAASDGGAALALSSDPDLLALALLGPPSSIELQALAGRAVHAVLAALPASTQLDSALPAR